MTPIEKAKELLALAIDPEACIKGTPMIPIHRNSLALICRALIEASEDAERYRALVAYPPDTQAGGAWAIAWNVFNLSSDKEKIDAAIDAARQEDHS